MRCYIQISRNIWLHFFENLVIAIEGKSVWAALLKKKNPTSWRLALCGLMITSIMKRVAVCGRRGARLTSYPLNVSRDRSLLLLVGGGGRMLSVTGAAVMPGEPSSFIMKLHWHCFTGQTASWAQRATKAMGPVWPTEPNQLLLTLQGRWLHRLQLQNHSSIQMISWPSNSWVTMYSFVIVWK